MGQLGERVRHLDLGRGRVTDFEVICVGGEIHDYAEN